MWVKEYYNVPDAEFGRSERRPLHHSSYEVEMGTRLNHSPPSSACRINDAGGILESIIAQEFFESFSFR